MVQSEKQKCIKSYYDNVKQAEATFKVKFDDLSKGQKKFLLYKHACLIAHPDCDMIPKNEIISDFLFCQARCKYSYENRFN